MRWIAIMVALLAANTAVAATAPVSRAERAIHERLLVLDTHFDTPVNFARSGWSMMQRHAVEVDGSQVDHPRMVDGGVDGGFFAIFTPQGPRGPQGDQAARDAAVLRATEIREMVAANPTVFELATKPDQAAEIAGRGKRFVYLSMENGAPFGRDLSLMQTFYDLGVRMMGPVHFTNNDLADSATDPRGPEWKGLSPLGRQFVSEANRLGVVIDASHASDAALDEMLRLSRAPIILSHSGCRAIFDHPRNVDDARLRALAAKGGVIQVNAFSAYMVSQPDSPDRKAALAALMKRMRNGPHDEAHAKAFTAERRAIDARWPVPRATFDDVVKHLLHAIEVAGIDHVGISGDFDGGGGVEGFDDVTAFPKITAALLRAGYTQSDIAKVWGGNALRVMREAQAAAEPRASSEP